jgi:pimeloyl-ACP methyl ester carboxylesterase
MHFYCTALAAAVFAVAGTQPVPAPATGEAAFNIFFQGTQIGREHVTLSRAASGWIITSNGRQLAPINAALTRLELKYADDWQPLELKLEGTLRSTPITLATSFTLTTAINEITQNAITSTKEDVISARTVVAPVLPVGFFAGYEVLAARLAGSGPQAEVPLYFAPRLEMRVTVRAVTPETLSGPAGTLRVRRFDLTFNNPGNPFEASMLVDERSRLVRLELPSASLTAIREDVSSVAVRSSTMRNATDTDVTITANGFQLAGSLTAPPTVAGRLRFPGVVLIGETNRIDRDQTVEGIPIFAQLANALAEGGAMVLRYDPRGYGQSGGRTEAATFADYSDDALAAVRWLSKRKDVDPRKVFVVGYGLGGDVALMAASRDKRIKGMVTIAAPGSIGADLILEQQRSLLESLNLSDEDKQAKIDLQKQIHEAVVNGTGWDKLPPDVKKQADTPLFRSMLTFDPGRVLTDTKQPVLIVHGDLDAQVPPTHADRLAELARGRKKAGKVEVLRLPGVNHSLISGADGDAQRQRSLSPKVSAGILEWLTKTF